jgi:hypothetical protein
MERGEQRSLVLEGRDRRLSGRLERGFELNLGGLGAGVETYRRKPQNKIMRKRFSSMALRAMRPCVRSNAGTRMECACRHMRTRTKDARAATERALWCGRDDLGAGTTGDERFSSESRDEKCLRFQTRFRRLHGAKLLLPLPVALTQLPVHPKRHRGDGSARYISYQTEWIDRPIPPPCQAITIERRLSRYVRPSRSHLLAQRRADTYADKQSNKSFKSKHASKGSLKAAAKGALLHAHS